MMTATTTQPPAPLLTPTLETIPAYLRTQYPKRWSVWVATWDVDRGKWDKKPVHTNNLDLGLSSRRAWFSFDEAADAYGDLALVMDGGVGLNMTNVKGLVGIDLDRCVDVQGRVASWAAEILERCGSYAEVSPSGRGLRIFTRATLPQDWVNHEQGIEVYGGNAPRFLTVTGRRLTTTPVDVEDAPAGFIDWLASTYRRQRDTATADDLPDGMPEILDEAALPPPATLDLPAQVAGFLDGSISPMDRSSALQSAAVALYNATATPEGQLRDDVVLSALYHNVQSWACAMDHRRQDPDRALAYLWEHHCLKARDKADPVIADFDVVELTPDELQAEQEAAEAVEAAIRERFQLHDLTEFTQQRQHPYMIKGILPQAELGVIFGESGSGKSFFTWDMAVHVAMGREWRGKRVRQGRVVYVCAEGAGGFRKRVRAYAMHHQLDLSTVPIKVLADAPNFLSKDDHKLVAKRIKEVWGGADLIVIDTLAQTTPGANENAAEDMGKALGNLKALHRYTGAMVVLVHHSGKDASKGARGWSGLKAAADVEIEITRFDRCRVARLSKSKDDIDGSEFGFDLEVVAVGEDEDGDVITSCVAVETAVDKGKAAAAFKPNSPTQRLVLETIMQMAEAQTEGIEVTAVVTAVLPLLPEAENADSRCRANMKMCIKRAIDRMSAREDCPFMVENGCISIV